MLATWRTTPRQQKESWQLHVYFIFKCCNCLDLFCTILVNILHKKRLRFFYIPVYFSLQEMQEEAKTKKPKKTSVSSSSRLAGWTVYDSCLELHIWQFNIFLPSTDPMFWLSGSNRCQQNIFNKLSKFNQIILWLNLSCYGFFVFVTAVIQRWTEV